MHEHDDTGDKLEHAYFCYLADKFEREPELLEIPLRTIKHWRTRDLWGWKHIDHWESLIQTAQKTCEGMECLTQILRADDEETRFFKGFAPFPGVLNDAEKKQFICASRH